jgi:hypothetical protein
MVHLVSVHDEFEARLIAARLGSDGILTEIRAPLGSPYPLMGELQIYVGEGDLSLAKELLVSPEPPEAGPIEPPGQADGERRGAPAWGPFALVLILVVVVVLAALV